MRLVCLLLLIVVVLFSSCKKKTMVLMQAKDYITGDGSAYANQPYAVIETWTPVFNLKAKTVVSGFLDENGYASFELKMNGNRSYIMGVTPPDNICHGGLELHYLEHGKANKVDFEFLKCGSLNLQFDNVLCEGQEDKFRNRYYYLKDKVIYDYHPYLMPYTDDWNPENFIGGCNTYLGDESLLMPVGEYVIEWQVERSSGITEGSDTFTLTENDTTTVLIEY